MLEQSGRTCFVMDISISNMLMVMTVLTVWTASGEAAVGAGDAAIELVNSGCYLDLPKCRNQTIQEKYPELVEQVCYRNEAEAGLDDEEKRLSDCFSICGSHVTSFSKREHCKDVKERPACELLEYTHLCVFPPVTEAPEETPTTESLNVSTKALVDGNTTLSPACVGSKCARDGDSSGYTVNGYTVKLAVGLVVGAAVVIGIIVLIICCRGRMKNNYKLDPDDGSRTSMNQGDTAV